MAGKALQVKNICTCTARAQCIPAPFFIRRQVGLAKVYPCTEFGVPRSKFPSTEGPLVKKCTYDFPPLARATCTPQKWHPQWILSWYGLRATCKFGIGGATRVPLRAAIKWCVQNSCTCTARAQCIPTPFFIRRQVGLAKVHPCTDFGVASSNFTFTGGPHVKKAFRLWRVQPAPHRNGTPNGF